MRRIAATILGATLALTLAVGRVSAAEGVITLNLKDARLSQVLDLVKQQVAFEYVLTPGVNGDAPVTIAISNKPFNEALKLVLSTAKASFDVIQDVYIIKPADAGGAAGGGAAPTAPPTTPGLAGGGFTGTVPRATTPPRPTATRPAASTNTMGGPGAPAAMPGLPGMGTGADAPNSTASAKGVTVLIPLNYADAPMLAQLFYNVTPPTDATSPVTGVALRYYDMQYNNNNNNNGGGGYGNNNNNNNNNGGGNNRGNRNNNNNNGGNNRGNRNNNNNNW